MPSGFMMNLQLGSRDMEIARRVIKEIRDRLGFLERVGLRLPYSGQILGYAVRRRVPEDQACHAGGLFSGRGIVHPGRTEHRSSSEGQSAAAWPLLWILEIRAILSWWSNTTRRLFSALIT